MPYADDDDRQEAELHERESPDAADVDDSDETEFLPCPYCRKPVYEQADVCPHCRSFITFESESNRKRPWFLIGVAIALLIAASWAIFG